MWPEVVHARHLIICLALAALPLPAPAAGQSQSVRGQLAGVVFGYATQWERSSHPPVEHGLGPGISLRAVFSRPHQPELHVESALLFVSRVEGGCFDVPPIGACKPRRVFHPIGMLRGALTWPLRPDHATWYLGFGIGGYFPIDEQRVLPDFAAGPDLTLSRRGLTSPTQLFVEARISYLTGKAVHGGALLLLSGIEF